MAQITRIHEKKKMATVTLFPQKERKVTIEELVEAHPYVPTEIYDLEQSYEMANMWEEAFGYGGGFNEDDWTDSDALWEANHMVNYNVLWGGEHRNILGMLTFGAVSTKGEYGQLCSMESRCDEDLILIAENVFGKDVKVLEINGHEIVVEIGAEYNRGIYAQISNNDRN